ncbi:MAG: hypothetical protein KDA42_09545 [Planctomycetales bacterium]|nr:hypothetical protein [Planctomycetales bacterium]
MKLPVDSATVIEIGDLVYLDTDDVKPISGVTYGANLTAAQEAAHDGFLGVAMQASAAGDTNEIRVATSGVFEFDQATATVELGSRVGCDDNAAGDTLLTQQVIAVDGASPQLAIGRCARRTSSATKILVSIKSTVMNDGPQAVA